jgi:hypothetical protein
MFISCDIMHMSENISEHQKFERKQYAMSKKIYPTDLLNQAFSVQDAWVKIDEGLTFGSLGMGALVMDINGLRNVELSLVSLENQMTDLRNQREALQQTTWDKVKRVRASVKGMYGDDSAQYELIGGTRLSDRKSMRKSPLPAEQP